MLKKVMAVETEDKLVRIEVNYDAVRICIALALTTSSIPAKDIGKLLLLLALLSVLLGVKKYELGNGFRLRIGAFTVDVEIMDKE